MRKDVILAVANAIENAELVKHDVGFNMSALVDTAVGLFPDRSGYDCGTVACIAGTTAIMFNNDGTPRSIGNKYEILSRSRACCEVAQEAMGISPSTGVKLFMGCGSGHLLSHIKPEHAVRVLRNLAETGVVNWRV